MSVAIPSAPANRSSPANSGSTGTTRGASENATTCTSTPSRRDASAPRISASAARIIPSDTESLTSTTYTTDTRSVSLTFSMSTSASTNNAKSAIRTTPLSTLCHTGKSPSE